MNAEDVEPGYKLPVLNPKTKEYVKAEIVGKRSTKYGPEFYVHYIGLNRRLDEWVKKELLKLSDPSEIEAPRKKKKTEESKRPLVQKTSEDEDTKNVTKAEDEFKIKNVKKIQIRNYLLDAWYFSPYPKCIAECSVIYICEFCLYYYGTEENLAKHAAKCNLRHPPGNEIYRDGDLSFFELDGFVQKNYCRNLSLLSKLFLDHKSLYYDIDVFMYYILCKRDEYGYQIVGYFSKEKISEQGYNLACILTLPYEQRRGYGRMLMDFSYMLSKKEHKIAGPEKPLSDLGLLSYRAYWLEVVVECLLTRCEVSIKEISQLTHISEDDIIGTLCSAGILKFYKNDFVYVINELHVNKASKGRLKKLDEKYLCKDYC